MRAAERFIDTNVLVYLLSGDARRADRAQEAVEAGGVISVQVLNEFAEVAMRKLGMAPSEIREVLGAVRAACECVPLTVETHDAGLQLARKHRLSVYDAMIVASAQLSGCRELLTEDLNDGQRFGTLVVRNPFR